MANEPNKVKAVIQQTLQEMKGSNTELKPHQEDAVICLLNSQHVLAVLPTGFGKSLIFQVFVRAKAKLAAQNEEQFPAKILVICPLVGLVKDQQQEAESMGISCVTLKGMDLQKQVNADIIFA